MTPIKISVENVGMTTKEIIRCGFLVGNFWVGNMKWNAIGRECETTGLAGHPKTYLLDSFQPKTS